MHSELVQSGWLLSESERSVSSEVAFADVPPRPGELFRQVALALAIPLVLALIANLVLSACGIPAG
jgi:hypothetical protein